MGKDYGFSRGEWFSDQFVTTLAAFSCHGFLGRMALVGILSRLRAGKRQRIPSPNTLRVLSGLGFRWLSPRSRLESHQGSTGRPVYGRLGSLHGDEADGVKNPSPAGVKIHAPLPMTVKVRRPWNQHHLD